MPNNLTVLALCAPSFAEAQTDDFAFDCEIFESLKYNLCHEVIPFPEELDGVWAKDEPEKQRWRETDGEKIFLEQQEIAEIEAKYGTSDGLDWAIENWGTKWGTYETKAQELDGDGSPILITFQCANHAPNAECWTKIDHWLRERYKFDSISWSWFDPCDYKTRQFPHDDPEIEREF